MKLISILSYPLIKKMKINNNIDLLVIIIKNEN